MSRIWVQVRGSLSVFGFGFRDGRSEFRAWELRYLHADGKWLSACGGHIEPQGNNMLFRVWVLVRGLGLRV